MLRKVAVILRAPSLTPGMARVTGAEASVGAGGRRRGQGQHREKE
jgi:hypothetical protein